MISCKYEFFNNFFFNVSHQKWSSKSWRTTLNFFIFQEILENVKVPNLTQIYIEMFSVKLVFKYTHAWCVNSCGDLNSWARCIYKIHEFKSNTKHHCWKYMGQVFFIQIRTSTRISKRILMRIKTHKQTKKSLLFLSVFHSLYTVLGVVAGSYLYWFWAAAGLAVSPSAPLESWLFLHPWRSRHAPIVWPWTHSWKTQWIFHPVAPPIDLFEKIFSSPIYRKFQS